MMTILEESKGFSLHFVVIFFLYLSFCDGFLVHQTPRSNVLTRSTDEAIEAAAFGESSNGDAIMSAAAAITKESCQLLGVKSLGVDYGLVRTGVAATVGYDPTPLKILSNLNNTEVSGCVVEMCRAEQANQVVVGLPLHKNGTEANQTTITRVFAAQLADHVIRNLVRITALPIKVFHGALCCVDRLRRFPFIGAKRPCATIRREIHI
mmetsp:Transcript_21521/g.53179  ORF Transcript_21521/g.53179 Transcript_21521/m.53179 type:complete len:208 (+) Transcript_21521:4324-4947(+)